MFVITPTALEGFTNGAYVDAVAELAQLEMGGAMEAFTFNVEKFNAQALNASIKSATNFQHAITRWDSALSAKLNECIGKSFNANKATIKLLVSDINKYRNDLRQLDRARKEKGLTQSVYETLNIQYHECEDRLEKARNKVAELRKSITMPPAMVAALKQTNTLSMQTFAMMAIEYKKYEELRDSFYDPKHPKYQIDVDDFIKDMRALINGIEVKGAIRTQTDVLSGKIVTITKTTIYGKPFDPAAEESSAKYDLTLVQSTSVQYTAYRDMTRKVYRRVAELHEMLVKVQRGTDDSINVNAVITELTFLMVYMPLYGKMMQLYFEPKIAVIDSITR